MGKLFIRSGFNPLYTYSPYYALSNNMLGGNSGNLLYTYGVMNALNTEDTVFIPSFNKKELTDEEIDYINLTCDAFIIPLADAFRSDFVIWLERFTKWIKKLKIPCIVIGVGLRTEYEPKFENSFDEDVKRFVSAVLEHSSMLGLRGNITGEYLKRLGFVEERDYKVIGCPSMYSRGLQLTLKRPNEFKKIGFNINTLVPQIEKEFFRRSFLEYSDSVLIQQKKKELKCMFLGEEASIEDHVFSKAEFDELNEKDRIRFFLNVPQWIDYMKPFDLFVGSRFHGTVAAILAGVPSVFLPFDGRTRELVEYHHIPHIAPYDIKENTTIKDYLEKLDLYSVETAYEENFNVYLSFLGKNGLKTSMDKKGKYIMGRGFAVEKELIKCAASCTQGEIQQRKNMYDSNYFFNKQ